jgi:MFS family permease
MKDPFRQFTRNFYIYRFLCDCALIYAVYILLFKIRGLSEFEISLLLAVWCFFVVIFEIPAGVLADRWSRKNLIALGMIFKATGFGCWYFAYDFFLFALGFLFWGLQESLTSGALEALLYDELKKFNRIRDYEKITGKGHFFSKIGTGIALFLGGALSVYGHDRIILISIFTMSASVIPVILFPKDKNYEESGHSESYARLIRYAFLESRKNTVIFRLLIYTALIIGIVGTVEEYVQLYFDWLGLSVSFFGLGLVFLIVIEALGNRIAYLFSKRLSFRYDLEMLGVLSGICLFISVRVRSVWMIPVFSLIFFIIAVCEVLIESRLQNEIRSKKRATMMSVASLILNLSAIPFLLLYGLISKTHDLSFGFKVFALLMALYSVFIAFWHWIKK